MVKRKCVRGWPCGNSCITRKKKCRSNLNEDGRKLVETFSQYIVRLGDNPVDENTETLERLNPEAEIPTLPQNILREEPESDLSPVISVLDRSMDELRAQLGRNDSLNYLLEPLPESEDPLEIATEIENRRGRLIRSINIDNDDFVAGVRLLNSQSSSSLGDDELDISLEELDAFDNTFSTISRNRETLSDEGIERLTQQQIQDVLDSGANQESVKGKTIKGSFKDISEKAEFEGDFWKPQNKTVIENEDSIRTIFNDLRDRRLLPSLTDQEFEERIQRRIELADNQPRREIRQTSADEPFKEQAIASIGVGDNIIRAKAFGRNTGTRELIDSLIETDLADTLNALGFDNLEAVVQPTSASINWSVNDSFITTNLKPVEGLSDRELAMRVGSAARIANKEILRRLPSGTILTNSPAEGDGKRGQRIKLYKRAGFGDPDELGIMRSIKIGDKLYPITDKQLSSQLEGDDLLATVGLAEGKKIKAIVPDKGVAIEDIWETTEDDILWALVVANPSPKN